MKRGYKTLALCAALAISAFAQASQIDQYLADMAGDDEAKRVAARQGLRRSGAEAVPGLVELVSDEREVVWRGAYNTLADIANASAAPGREAERIAVADALAPLLASDRTYAVKERGLRLMAIAAPPGYNLGRISAYMNDKDLALKARDALQVIGSREARLALQNHLGRSGEAMDVALIDALARIGHPDSVQPLTAMLDSRSAATRIAAMRALAPTGDPALRVPYQRAMKGLDDEQAPAAGDAYLRLADAVIAQGANWEIAMAIYKEVLASSADPQLVGAAMAGLGRHGDATVVPLITQRLANLANPDLEAPAAMALGYLKGREAYRAVLAAYPAQNASMKYSLLRGFGRNGDPVFAELLAAEAASEDADLKEAAAIALADAGLPQGVSLTIAALEAAGADDEARKLPIKRLRALAAAMAAKNDAEAAGAAYAALYRLAGEDAHLRQLGLDGVKRFPVPSAIEAVMADLSVEQMDALPKETLVSFALALEKAGRAEDAAKVWDRLGGAMGDTAAAQTLIALAGQYGIDGAAVAQKLGVVSAWRIAGPFPWNAADGFAQNPVNAPGVDFAASYGEVTWQVHKTGDAAGVVNLAALLGERSNAMAFAAAKINVPVDQPRDAVLNVGSDDGVKIWLNGAVVHENNVDRGFALDDDTVAVKLDGGENHIVVQITQGGGGWNFGMRFTTPDGGVVPFTIVE